MRQNKEKRLKNRQKRSQMRTAVKRFRRFLDENKIEDARQVLHEVYAIIDRTAQKGMIHANTAARYKSRLAKRLNGLGAAASS